MPSLRLQFVALSLMLLSPLTASAQHVSQAALSRVALNGNAAEAAATSRFNGNYRFVSGQRSVDRSVEEVANAFDFFTRAFARPILEDRNQPYSHIELRLDADSSRFVLGEWGPVHTRFGATRSVSNERGERVRVRQFMRSGRLVQTLTTDQGTRTNTITLSQDGQRLVVRTVITSDRLPMPLRYRLVYARQAGIAAR